MGLSHYPTASEGVMPMLVMNTVVSVSLLKNMVRSVLHMLSFDETNEARNRGDDQDHEDSERRGRRVSVTHFEALCENRGSRKEREAMECCVCLCRFKEKEEVSELVSCKHYFHTACLDKWFGNNHTTCPLCRSIL
ncbi:hypothetical protein CARUB_v10021695mg [Capsella rubella]|uniref:RING-type domain-containing protein n=1 Tax=Capsella rubella TaxID=81985 RepID=R0GC50_9BRAS|nr:probable E3 ubiquitin-protein ligase XERICO [Capsella rubella]EOA33317.1 hypothetical protein CARUB_v10021695mg [Capsella rubella]